MMQVYVFEDYRGWWRWRIDDDGLILARSSMRHRDREGAERELKRVTEHFRKDHKVRIDHDDT